MKALFLLFLLPTLAFAKLGAGGVRALETLRGTYADPAPVDWGRGTYGVREFTFKNGRWTLSFVLALDSAMKAEVFSFRTYGSYKVIGKSATIPGAFDAIFFEDKKFLTLLTPSPDLARNFGLSTCSLRPGEEKDISDTGCALWKPVELCNEDHELLALDGDGQLYFGIRPEDNDMCTSNKRPTRLNVPVTKKGDL